MAFCWSSRKWIKTTSLNPIQWVSHSLKIIIGMFILMCFTSRMTRNRQRTSCFLVYTCNQFIICTTVSLNNMFATNCNDFSVYSHLHHLFFSHYGQTYFKPVDSCILIRLKICLTRTGCYFMTKAIRQIYIKWLIRFFRLLCDSSCNSTYLWNCRN